MSFYRKFISSLFILVNLLMFLPAMGDTGFDYYSLPHNGYYDYTANNTLNVTLVTANTSSNVGGTFLTAFGSFTRNPVVYIDNQNLPDPTKLSAPVAGFEFLSANNPTEGYHRVYSENAANDLSTPARYLYIGLVQYKINFQASGSAPTGYNFSDNGTAISSNLTGYDPYFTPAYGWANGNVTPIGNTINASYAIMPTNAIWQMQLPSTAARYWVTATLGNANITSNTSLTGNNAVLLVNGLQVPLTLSGNLYSGGIEVEVTNGNLTVQNQSGFSVPLCHVEVTHLGQVNGHGRYLRGTGYNPGFQSFVVPLDDEIGTETLNLINANLSPSAQPWFEVVPYYDPIANTRNTAPYHVAITNGNISANGTVTNGNVSYGVSINGTQQAKLLSCAQPFVCFGNTTWSGTPLFAGRTYNFGVYSGWLQSTDSQAAIVILAYPKTTNITSTTSPASVTRINIPSTDNATSNSTFVNNGFSITNTSTDGGLETTIRYLPSTAEISANSTDNGLVSDSTAVWDVDTMYGSGVTSAANLFTTPGQTKAHFPILITHKALNSNYRYVIYGIGHSGFWTGLTNNITFPSAPSITSGGILTINSNGTATETYFNLSPNVVSMVGNSTTMRYEPLYALEFNPAPAWQTNVLSLKNFQGTAQPMAYGGLSSNQLASLPGTIFAGGNVVINGNTVSSGSAVPISGHVITVNGGLTSSANLSGTLVANSNLNGAYFNPVAPLVFDDTGNSTSTSNITNAWLPYGYFTYNNGNQTWTSRMGITTLRPPEFDASPLLDDFVTKMGNDPIALAAYVQNEIQLTNVLSNPESNNGSGQVSANSFNWAGMDRGALGTFLEGRGSPLEQCALLIYLLRQAGYEAVYVFPSQSQFLSLSQIEGMTGLNLQGASTSLGAQFLSPIAFGNTSLYAVNYPWVAVHSSNYDGQNHSGWVNLFPWLKDIQITEGRDLWGSLPLSYRDPLVWMHQYLRQDNQSAGSPLQRIFLPDKSDRNLPPSVLFPKWVNNALAAENSNTGAGFDLGQIGLQRLQRQHTYSTWADFPLPIEMQDLKDFSALIPTAGSGGHIYQDMSSFALNGTSQSIYNDVQVRPEVHNVSDGSLVSNLTLTPLDLEAPRAHNARIYLSWQDSSFTQARMVVAPYANLPELDSSSSYQAFTANGTTNLTLNLTYTRNQRVSSADPSSPAFALAPAVFLVNSFQNLRTVKAGDLADVCVQYDTVTNAMLSTHASNFAALQQSIASSSSYISTGAANFTQQEQLLSVAAAINGYQYFRNVDTFTDKLISWNKMAPVTNFSMGLSKISTFGTQTTRTVPNVDMFFDVLSQFANESADQTTGEVGGTAIRNFEAIYALESSAQEAASTQAFYSQNSAVYASTVGLLEQSEHLGVPVLVITAGNFSTVATTRFPAHDGIGGSSTLPNAVPGIWSAIQSSLQADPYSIAYVTPGRIENGSSPTSSTFDGYGALIVSKNGMSALISNTLQGGVINQVPYLEDTDIITSVILTDAPGADGTLQLTQSMPNPTIPSSQLSDGSAIIVLSTINNTGWSNASGNYSPDTNDKDAFFINAFPLINGNATTNNTAFDWRQSNSSFGTYTDGVWIPAGLQVNEPVNTATGEYYVDETDLVLPGPLPLELRRNYSSFAAGNSTNNLLGFGWKLSLMPYLQQNPDNSLMAALPDGSVIDFTANTTTLTANTSWSVNAAHNPYLNNYNNGAIGSTNNWFNANITLTGNSGNYTYTVNQPDGGKAIYQQMSFPLNSNITRQRPYLTKWMDAQGNFLSFTFDGNATLPGSSVPNNAYGQVARILSSNGNYFTFEYDAFGHVTDVLARDGRRVHYDFDNANGDLVGVTRPDGSQVTYTYNESANSSMSNPYHLLTEVDEPEGRRLLNNYDAYRRVSSQQTLAGPDGNMVTTANYSYSPVTPNNSTKTFTTTVRTPGTSTIYTYYQPYVNGVLTDSLLLKTSLGTSPAIVTQYNWYLNGTTMVNSSGVPSNLTSNSSYMRNLKSTIDPRDLETDYTYDSHGNMLSKTISSTTPSAYDLLGDSSNSTAKWTFSYTAGNSTIPANLLTDVYGPTNGSGSNTSVYLHEHTDYGNFSDNLTYMPIAKNTTNASGNIVSLQKFIYGYASSPSTDSDPAPVAYGLLCSTYLGDSSGNGTVTALQYDGQGYPVEKARFIALQPAPTGATNITANASISNASSLLGTTSANSSTAYITSYTTDLRGMITQEIDPGGKTTNYTYDDCGRPTSVNIFNGATLVSTTSTYYDGNGLATWIDGPRSGAAEDFVQRSYTPLGQLSAEMRWRTQARPDGSGVMQVPGADQLLNQTMTVYNYDPDGNLLQITDSNGNAHNYTYDAACRRLTDSIVVNGQTLTTHYTYEPGGKVASTTNPIGALTTYAYTATGQLKKQTNPDNTTHFWTYFEDGRVNKETLSNGNTWLNAYTDNTHTTTRTFSGNEADSVTGGNATETTVRDVRGNVITHTNLDGYTSNSTFDGLDRPVLVSGPVPGNTTITKQQTANYTYDPANLTTTVTNANSETTTTITDVLGRPISVRVANSGNTTIALSSYSYSADFTSTTITEGGNTSTQITRTVYTDEAGHPILTKYSDGNYTVQTYDGNGNLLSTQDEMGKTTSYTYDALNRLVTTTTPDGAVVTLGYDGAGHLKSRTMPNGMVWNANYNSNNQQTNENLTNGGQTRVINYNYYPASNTTTSGLIKNITETSRGAVTNYNTYTAFGRPSNITFNGTGNIVSFTRTLAYDNRGNLRDATDNYGTAAPTTEVTRTYDEYGQLISDLVKSNTANTSNTTLTVVSNLTQEWDSRGERTNLLNDFNGTALPVFNYAYDAAGHMTQVTENITGNVDAFNYTYDTNGLLLTRANRWRDVTIASRDVRGRPTSIISAEGSGYTSPVTRLTETPSWRADGRMSSYGLTRNLTGNSFVGSETRAYTYDVGNHLVTETFGTDVSNGSGGYTSGTASTNYGFATGNSSTTGNVGVRVSANTSSSTTPSVSGNWSIPLVSPDGLNGFAQAVSEIQAGKSILATGGITSTSSNTTNPFFNVMLSCTLATGFGNVSIPASQITMTANTSNTSIKRDDWSVPLLLSPGTFTLSATLKAGSNATISSNATSNFTVTAASGSTNITNKHDGGGYISERDWILPTLTPAQTTQTDILLWDAAGRLLRIVRRDGGGQNGFNERSIYDPLGRRIQTFYTPVASGNASTTAVETTNSWYDPQTEFLEVAVSSISGNGTGGSTSSSGLQWKVYGPDNSGTYGGLQGVGGLEVVLDIGASKASAVWSDLLGHVEGYSAVAAYTATPGAFTLQSRSSGYGALPGEAVIPRWSVTSGATGANSTLVATLGWQERRMDASGYYCIGAREYNPVSGRFLSPDPLGHSASWDLYSYADGDPINKADVTGRSWANNETVQGLETSNSINLNSTGFNIDGTFTVGPSAYAGMSTSDMQAKLNIDLQEIRQYNIDLGRDNSDLVNDANAPIVGSTMDVIGRKLSLESGQDYATDVGQSITIADTANKLATESTKVISPSTVSELDTLGISISGLNTASEFADSGIAKMGAGFSGFSYLYGIHEIVDNGDYAQGSADAGAGALGVFLALAPSASASGAASKLALNAIKIGGPYVALAQVIIFDASEVHAGMAFSNSLDNVQGTIDNTYNQLHYKMTEVQDLRNLLKSTSQTPSAP